MKGAAVWKTSKDRLEEKEQRKSKRRDAPTGKQGKVSISSHHRMQAALKLVWTSNRKRKDTKSWQGPETLRQRHLDLVSEAFFTRGAEN